MGSESFAMVGTCHKELSQAKMHISSTVYRENDSHTLDQVALMRIYAKQVLQNHAEVLESIQLSARA